MKIQSSNYKNISWLIFGMISVSVLVSYQISLLLEFFKIDIPYYIDIPITTPAVFYLLFELFDKYLWKMKIFRWLGIINYDNLHGTWRGTIKSSYDNFENDINAELLISQTAFSIKIRGRFNSSKSISVHESFEKSEIDQSTALFYFYRNEPNSNAIETMSIHEGSVKLVYDKTNDKLNGYYYSGRDRNNHGTIDVSRI